MEWFHDVKLARTKLKNMYVLYLLQVQESPRLGQVRSTATATVGLVQCCCAMPPCSVVEGSIRTEGKKCATMDMSWVPCASFRLSNNISTYCVSSTLQLQLWFVNSFAQLAWGRSTVKIRNGKHYNFQHLLIQFCITYVVELNLILFPPWFISHILLVPKVLVGY